MLAKTLMGIGVSLALLGGHAWGQGSEDEPSVAERLVYPANVWARGTVPEESASDVEAIIDKAMTREFADVMGETRELVVVYKGRLVAEAYREGFNADTKLVSWSMAKSITQALVGRAVHEGLVENIDAPMPGPWEASDPRSQITWREWLTMTDGLDYSEVGEADLAKNDVVQMMFGPGRYDMVGYVKTLPQIHEAGTHWNYSTAAFHTISQALQDAFLSPGLPLALKDDRLESFLTEVEEGIASNVSLGKTDEAEARSARLVLKGVRVRPFAQRLAYLKAFQTKSWIRTNLFTPLGMDAQPEFDAAGTFLGGSLIYASARDFARFGYLYLRDGVWNGERLLPEGWVDFATTAHESTDTNIYGAGWWITPDKGEVPTHAQSAKSAPYDAFHAGGNEGQTIWVVPSKDLVIVRLGLMSNAPENWAALYEWNQELSRAFPDK